MTRIVLFWVVVVLIPPMLGQDLSYENHNQVDYGPLKISKVSGVANDPGGGPVPDSQVLLFTELDHTLVAKTKTDRDGHFRLGSIRPGSYRLVVKAFGFCTANVRLLINKSNPHKKLMLHMEVGGIDQCSYGSQE
jgi:Carboxypeptidase regulatory-like domain